MAIASVDLNKISFVDQDFSTATTAIRNFLNDNYPEEFNDYVNSNLGVALIDIIAFAEQNLLWYLNRKITDLYFPTAVTPNAVSKLARLLGYKSAGATTAKTTVSITLPDGPFSFPVTINNGFQFVGPNNTKWEYRNEVPVVFDPGESLVSGIVLAQGETVVNNFVSDGENNQFFELLSVPVGKFVEAESVVVKVDGVEWTEQSIIPFELANNYETNLLAFPPVVLFGDSIQGNVPPINSGIEISYVITDGFRGRIVSNVLEEPVVGLVAQFEDIDITISQPDPSVGGDDPEDIRSIVTNAPLFQRTQNRAITKGDYDFLSNQFTDVAKADAQIIRGVSGDIVINTLFSSIITSVSALSDGIIQETSGFLGEMEGHVDDIVSEADDLETTLLDAIDPKKDAISGLVDEICSGVYSEIDASRVDIGVSFDAAVVDLGEIDDESLELIDTVDTDLAVRIAGIKTVLDDIDANVIGTSGEAAVNSLVVIAKTKLDSMKSAIFALTTAANSVIDSETDSVKSNLDDIITEVESLSGNIETVVDPLKVEIGVELGQIDECLVSGVSSFQTSIETSVSGVEDNLDSINTVFINSTSGTLASVSGDIDALSAHLDEHLADSCNGNLVQVKVLGKDANREYVSPLQTTLDALKADLDTKKDVTHTISVVEGTVDVINVVVTIDVKVSENALEDDVVAAISDALAKSDVEPLGILVERDFDFPLYLWDIDAAIRDNVTEGDIDYLNVSIDGPEEYLDSAGNLISPTGSVIQVGSVTVNALPRFQRQDGVNV